MRCLKTGLIAVLLLSVLFSISTVAFASEEETDWSQVDWSQIDWNAIDWENVDFVEIFTAMTIAQRDGLMTVEQYYGFCDWLKTEATLKQLFAISRGADGASAELVSAALYYRFESDPYAVIQALALETGEVQETAIHLICYGGYPPDAFGRVLGSVRLPDTATAEEQAVWQAILDYAEEHWDVVPNTGDGIYAPVALLLASALGLTALVVNKKRFA